ncbi:MAG: GcrA cell cycle regulator [Sphingomonadaceae bacterium]|uniref:GcrA family cell cycle regulator n=1 Tax=Thermaurantiacus sp. TaxID=2820283 RepID=UPI00298F26C4|nr:GcrA family cell cycle regulator [Thermaurantiacus sp.]MCS6986866.1 GcrA cell cycle regulator [Sphingomonadaceae bacterium]MDW8415534.1 GcrA family cell cycle regulator [Thermaurantiacus sp.]
MPFVWTEERIALLKKLWQEGHTASQIAEALGEGLTRNAVIGKAHRLGLSQRPSPLKPAERATAVAENAAAGPPGTGAPGLAALPAEARQAPAVPTAPRRPPRPAKPAKVTLLDLTDKMCKWPIGHPDEPDFHFCGKPVHQSFPYCLDHCLVAYQSQLQRRDRPAGPPPPIRLNLPRPR